MIASIRNWTTILTFYILGFLSSIKTLDLSPILQFCGILGIFNYFLSWSLSMEILWRIQMTFDERSWIWWISFSFTSFSCISNCWNCSLITRDRLIAFQITFSTIIIPLFPMTSFFLLFGKLFTLHTWMRLMIWRCWNHTWMFLICLFNRMSLRTFWKVFAPTLCGCWFSK